MKNIEIYGVQELSTKESLEIEGGGFWESLFIVLFVFAAIFAPQN